MRKTIKLKRNNNYKNAKIQIKNKYKILKWKNRFCLNV